MTKKWSHRYWLKYSLLIVENSVMNISISEKFSPNSTNDKIR